MKHLILLRHADAVAAGLELPDFERPLSAHGIAQLKDVSQILQQQEIQCNKIIASPAKRTIQTAEAIMQSVGLPELVIDERIYHNKLPELIEIVNGLEDDLLNILLIGHNPTISLLLNMLSIDAKNYSLSTGGVCILRFDISSWQIELESMGEVLLFHSPH